MAPLNEPSYEGYFVLPDRDIVSKMLCFYDQNKAMDNVQYMSRFNVKDDENEKQDWR